MQCGLKCPLAVKHFEYFMVDNVPQHLAFRHSLLAALLLTERLQDRLSAVCPNYSSAENPSVC